MMMRVESKSLRENAVELVRGGDDWLTNSSSPLVTSNRLEILAAGSIPKKLGCVAEVRP